jgi:hypothetical protein
MMTFDGSTGYYNKSYTSSGNKITCMFRFNVDSWVGGNTPYTLFLASAPSTAQRLLANVYSSDFSVADRRLRLLLQVSDSTNSTQVCRFVSAEVVADGEDKYAFFSYDADNGTAVFEINGGNAIDVGHSIYIAPQVATLGAGASNLFVGAGNSGADKTNGQMGYVGMADAYLTNASDFYGSGLQELDETTWAEWGSQPLFWNQYGTMSDNKGSAGNMTANGTITGPE